MRRVIAAVCAVVVIGLIVILAVYAASLKPYQPITPYSNRYTTTTLNINAGAGVYRERDYYVSTTHELSTPANGELIINPVQLPDDEEAVPSIQRSSYTVENTITQSLYTRITNSKRSEERSGVMPEATVFSLAFENKLKEDSWHDLTIYNTQNTEEVVDSALIFAPSSAEQATAWENDVSLYLLDGGLTEHAAALLPGVNILNEYDQDGHARGALYTDRSLAIGSMPSALQDADANDVLKQAVRTNEPGVADVLQMDISQRITGTDLVFTAPEGKETLSSIQAPASRSYRSNSFVLEGGVIAVDEGATLVIGSGSISKENVLTGESDTGSTLSASSRSANDTIDLSPRAIIVDGGTLVLSDTTKNCMLLNTNIQVRNGGTLKIGSNVTINGNIYVYGGGTLEVHGSFVLNGEAIENTYMHEAPNESAENASPAGRTVIEETRMVPGGIFIFANNSLQTNGTPLGSGYFTSSIMWMIDGDDGMEPIMLSRAVHFLSAEGAPGYILMYNDYSCDEHTGSAHLCGHFGAVRGVVAPETYVVFSEDMAVVEAIDSRVMESG